MEDVLDMYKKPYNKAYPLVCVDEKSKQCVKEKRIPIPASPGKIERYDTEYERNGTCNIFMAVEPLQGKRYTKITDHRKKEDWAYFIKDLVDNKYPEAEKIILIQDNLNTHRGGSLYEAFQPEEAKRILDKLEIHYTPKHGSWLNMAEIEISHLSRQCLDKRIPDKKAIEKEVKAWENYRNNTPSKIDWQFTTDDARIKLKSLYPITIFKGS
jgi:hypothetical protein